MRRGPRKAPREKDLTSRYLGGDWNEDRIAQQQRFSHRSKTAEQDKIVRTALMRAEEEVAAGDVETLPAGEVVQVYSLYSEVEHEGQTYLCVVRKTLTKISDTAIVVGDQVRFRVVTPAEEGAATEPAPDDDEARRPREAVIEQILPRRTVMARAESFKGLEVHPIVANAGQMLVVASLRSPRVKWGLVDRMIVAAQGGGLRPVICLNKIDLALDEVNKAAPVRAGARARREALEHLENPDPAPPPPAADGPEDLRFAREVLAHYTSLGVACLETSVERGIGLDALRDLLRGQTTVLAGHSGVGKSSLIRSIQPHLDLRIGAISGYTDKGRHTTTSTRRYALDFGGAVVDTPGVKHFGLWGVTRENLADYFPDVAGGTAPEWRRESYERILASLG